MMDAHDVSFRISLSDSPEETMDQQCSSVNVPDSVCQAFQQDGFVSLPQVLDLDDVDALNDRLEKVLRGDYDRHQHPDKTPRLLKSHYRSGQFSTHQNTNKSTSTDVNVTDPPERIRDESSPISKNGDNYNDNNDGTNNNKTNNHKKKKQTGTASGPLGFSGNSQNVKVLQVINVHKADCLFRKLATNPTLAKIVAQLAGWDNDQEGGTRLAQDQVWAKPPGAPPLTFHRDSPYFMFDNPAVVTVWVALDTMDGEIGPLEYVKGSHRWGDGRVGSANQFFQPNGGLKLVRSAAEKEGISLNDIEIVSMAGLQAGGISIHDGRTWHGSGKNNSPSRPRRGLGLHFVPANVKFTDEAKTSKLWSRYVDDGIEGGELPDEDFPVVWKSS